MSKPRCCASYSAESAASSSSIARDADLEQLGEQPRRHRLGGDEEHRLDRRGLRPVECRRSISSLPRAGGRARCRSGRSRRRRRSRRDLCDSPVQMIASSPKVACWYRSTSSRLKSSKIARKQATTADVVGISAVSARSVVRPMLGSRPRRSSSIAPTLTSSTLTCRRSTEGAGRSASAARARASEHLRR